MFTQPKDPNKKTKPAYKKYCSYCHRTNHSISACFKKQQPMLDQNPHKNHLYSTFAHLLMTEQNNMIIIIDTEAEVPPKKTLTIKIIHKMDTVLHLETDFFMTKILLLHITLDHDMTHINAIHDLIARHSELHIDLLIDQTLVLDIDHALSQENAISQSIQIPTDHLPDQETLDIQDLAQILTPEIKSIQYNLKTHLTLQNLKYICIIPRQWQTL